MHIIMKYIHTHPQIIDIYEGVGTQNPNGTLLNSIFTPTMGTVIVHSSKISAQ